jgi:hypothetical protein
MRPVTFSAVILAKRRLHEILTCFTVQVFLFLELSATRTIWRAIFFFFRVTIQGVSPFRFPLRQ